MTIRKLMTLSVAAFVLGSFQLPVEVQARSDDCGSQHSLNYDSDSNNEDDYHWPTATSYCSSRDYRVDPRTGRRTEPGRRNMNHD